MKSQDLVWRSSDGRSLPFSEMETDHLHNLVAYLHRISLEDEGLRVRAVEGGFKLPNRIVQGHPLQDWMENGMKELEARGKRDLKEARKALKRLEGN